MMGPDEARERGLGLARGAILGVPIGIGLWVLGTLLGRAIGAVLF